MHINCRFKIKLFAFKNIIENRISRSRDNGRFSIILFLFFKCFCDLLATNKTCLLKHFLTLNGDIKLILSEMTNLAVLPDYNDRDRKNSGSW